MNVLVNAISISEGGGLVVLRKLLEEMSLVKPDIIWFVAAQANTLALIKNIPSMVALPFSWVNKSPLHHLYWYEYVLPKLARTTKADLCFSQTNFLPRRTLSCPSLLLIQHAGYFSEKFEELYFQFYKKRLKNFIWKQKKKWLFQSIKKATVVTVQTSSLAKAIHAQVGKSFQSTIVVPHGAGLIDTVSRKVREHSAEKIWKIGYITKFGVQKDFNTAFKAMRLLKNSKIPLKFVLTLGTENIEYGYIESLIKQYDIEDMIENHGEISDPEKIKALYDSLDIFIFPSLCESFGFTLVEAMKLGLPVVVADTLSNREVSGMAGNFYKPEKEEDLAGNINQIINNRELYTLASKNSLERSQDFCWQKTAKNILEIMYQLTYEKK